MVPVLSWAHKNEMRRFDDIFQMKRGSPDGRGILWSGLIIKVIKQSGYLANETNRWEPPEILVVVVNILYDTLHCLEESHFDSLTHRCRARASVALGASESLV